MYGITLSLATLISLLLGEKLVKNQKLNPDIYWQTALLSILGGIIGARMYHVLSIWSYYSQNLWNIFDFRRGGLGILGGIIIGFISGVVFLKIKKGNVFRWMDLAAVLLPLAQAIGRTGNFFNHEIFGKPTNLPWAIYIPYDKRPNEYINNDMFHPLFLYEMILDLLLFLVLYKIYTRKEHKPIDTPTDYYYKFHGFFLLSYIIGYGTIRYFMEFLKINPWVITNINVAQFISLLFIFFGIFFLIKKLKNNS